MKITKFELKEKIVLPSIKFKINSRNHNFMDQEYSEVETQEQGTTPMSNWSSVSSILMNG